MNDWDDEDGWNDWDDGSSDDVADEFFDDDFTDVVPCSHCGAEIYEDAEQCPLCGEYVIHDTSAWTGKPAWWILLGLAGVFATVLALTWAVR